MLFLPVSVVFGILFVSISILLFLSGSLDTLRLAIIVYGMVILYGALYNSNYNENMSYIIYLPYITGPYLQLHNPIRKIIPIDMQTRCVYLSLPKHTHGIHFSFLIHPWDEPDNEYRLAIL
jgi:hypothetical protein